jgi:predicted RNase H-like HicB family nuclease
MNEQRAQAYVNLIEQLLACADGEELNNILQANQELIAPEFLQAMENYGTGLEEQGNNNPAAWLRNMAQQLGTYLNPQAGTIEEYQGFLLEVLQAEAEINDGRAIITDNDYYYKNMQYKVSLKQTEEGYAVWCPGLPGCASQGTTKEEALNNIQDAIVSYLEVAEELNQGVESCYVEVELNHA